MQLCKHYCWNIYRATFPMKESFTIIIQKGHKITNENEQKVGTKYIQNIYKKYTKN